MKIMSSVCAQQDESIEELIAGVSGLSSNDNTPQKPPPVKRHKDDGSPAKIKLFDDEYVVFLSVCSELSSLTLS